MVLAYPGRPHTDELRDWGLRLLELDTWIAGYATRIAKGSMAASEVPEVFDLIGQAGDLCSDLDRLAPRLTNESPLVEEYRSYAAALHRLVTEIGVLAGRP